MSRDESWRHTGPRSVSACKPKWETWWTVFTYLQHSQHRVQLVLSQRYVGGDFSQHVDGLQSHFLDFVVEHVDQEVQTLFGEAGR